MKEIALLNKWLFTTIGGVIGFVVGEADGFFYGLLLFMFIDYVTGVMAAIVERNLSSSIGKKGIFKKVMIICLVAVGQRKLRVDESEILKTMAEKLGVSSSFLSSVENGKKKIPKDWDEKLSRMKSYLVCTIYQRNRKVN